MLLILGTCRFAFAFGFKLLTSSSWRGDGADSSVDLPLTQSRVSDTAFT